MQNAKVVVPKPVTTFIKPSGKSASSKILINSKVEHDALLKSDIFASLSNLKVPSEKLNVILV